MLRIGPAFRVVIHLNADIASREDYLHNEIISFLHARNVSGATVFRPYAGFGLHHRIHREDAQGAEGEHLPIRIDFVEDTTKVEGLLPELFDLVTDGMIEVQETTVVRVAGKIFNPSSEDESAG
jgi:uncharacterized protein